MEIITMSALAKGNPIILRGLKERRRRLGADQHYLSGRSDL